MVAWVKKPSCVLVDPSWYSPEERAGFFSFLDENGLVPEGILLTHCHFDHIFGVREAQDRWNIPVWMNPAEEENLRYNTETAVKLGLTAPDAEFRYTPVKDSEHILVAGMDFTAIATPGHSPGGMCYLEKANAQMFTGDTLFAGTIGRTDLMFSEYDDEIRSIMEKLIILDPAISIWPGHGPSSSIAYERSHNPFLEPFNEPEPDSDEEVVPVEIHS